MIQLAAPLCRVALAPVLAEEGWREQRLRSMHEHFSTPDPLIYLRLGIGLFAVVAIFVVVKLLACLQRRRYEAAQAQPYALLVRVQAALGLPLLDRWRLWWVARALNLPNPTALLISSAFFDRAVEKYKPSRRRRVHLAAIRDRVFGATPATAINSATTP